MLSKEEELRVASYIDVLKIDLNSGKRDSDLTLEAQLWFANKAKELNEELKIVNRERNILQRQYVEGA